MKVEDGFVESLGQISSRPGPRVPGPPKASFLKGKWNPLFQGNLGGEILFFLARMNQAVYLNLPLGPMPGRC